MNSLKRSTQVIAALCLLGGAPAALAQTFVEWQGAPGTPGNWEEDDKWDLGFQPDASFDEVASISNGGTVEVDTNLFSVPGQIIVGRQVGDTGTLNIKSGGQVSAQVVVGNVSNGQIWVGGDGIGFMNVDPGGTISGRSLIVGGLDVGSIMTVGGAGAGVANVTIDVGAIVSREVRVVGPNVNFSTGTFDWYSTATYAPEITAATHSAIKVAGTVNSDNAILRPTFSNGVVPTVGDSWNLFDAAAINGSFTLDLSDAPELPVGQIYQYGTVADAGSVNGVYGQLSIEQRLVLNVNRQTGVMEIVGGPAPISFDGYSIQSGLGGINPSGWNSFQDQGKNDWRESPQGGSVNALSELKPTGAETLTNSTIAIGSTFQLPTPTEFNTELEDITFEYYSAGGVVTQGIVNYMGDKQYNNLVLVVDPDTGAARMENQSAISVSIDGYKIESESGSLLAGAGHWNSLDDQDTAGGDWRESNPSANLLAELKPTSSTLMSGGSNFGYNLGTLFKTVSAGGTEDLTFQYLFPGDTEFRDGVVAYRSIGGLTADFNGDGTVNGTDLAIWNGAYGTGAGGDANNDGQTNGADFLIWQQQSGMSSAAPTASSVPEPSTLAMIACAACSLAWAGQRRRGSPRGNNP